MAGHTPGPWTWDEGEAQYDEGAIFGPNKAKVCDFGSAYGYEQRCGIGPSGEDKAVMLAAPELLASVRELVATWEGTRFMLGASIIAKLARAEQAIAKAEGTK